MAIEVTEKISRNLDKKVWMVIVTLLTLLEYVFDIRYLVLASLGYYLLGIMDGVFLTLAILTSILFFVESRNQENSPKIAQFH